MNVSDQEDPHKSDHDLIVALYNQAMEEIRHRRNIEWQTLVAVNVV